MSINSKMYEFYPKTGRKSKFILTNVTHNHKYNNDYSDYNNNVDNPLISSIINKVSTKKRKQGNNKEENDYYNDCPGFNRFPKTIIKDVKRIIAIGDIHGDFNLAVKILRAAKVINRKNKWIGGKTVVVQIGDILDGCRPINSRCDQKKETPEYMNDIKVMKFFTDLDEEAEKDGGRVILLYGNHEMLNIKGNMRYVSYDDVMQFGQSSYADNLKKRKQYFNPKGYLGKYLGCTRLFSVVINDFLFVHAGFVKQFADLINIKKRSDLKKLNVFARKYATGNITNEYLDYLKEWFFKFINDDVSLNDVIDAVFGSDINSALWTRIYGKIPPNVRLSDDRCKDFMDIQGHIFGDIVMIFGHHPRINKKDQSIYCTCDKHVCGIDTGSSHAFGKHANPYCGFIEIIDNKIYIRIFKRS